MEISEHPARQASRAGIERNRAPGARTSRTISGSLAQALRQGNAAFAGHHHVDDQQVEIETDQLASRFIGVGGGRDAKTLFDQIAVEQIADTPVIVDDQ